MLKLLAHGINLVRNQLRDIGKPARSGKWPTVEKHFLGANPTCAACGTKIRLNIHHVKPFHDFPQLELDPTNLITLCMSRKECHLLIGHGGAFSRYNPNVEEDAVEALKHPNRFESIIERAHNNRLEN